jgi:hypothetical protein
MCVNASITLMLRAILADLDNETYTDERLEQLIVVAAKYVDMDLEKDYTVDILGIDITPDPVEQNDEIFVNLVVIKAACMIDQGSLRLKAALAGIEAVAGPARLKVGGDNFSAFRTLVEVGACAMYKTMRQDYQLGNGAYCHGILSPFTSNSFDADNLRNFSEGHRLIE